MEEKVRSFSDDGDEDKIYTFDPFSNFWNAFEAECISIDSMFVVLKSKMILIRAILPHRAHCCIYVRINLFYTMVSIF